MIEESKTLTPETTESPKPKETTSSPQDQEMFNLDVCFLIDTTISMQPSINMAREKIKEIIANLKSQYTDSEVRIAVVSYKDHGDKNQYQIFPFNTSVDVAHSFLASLSAEGGGDYPEDINGGFRHVLKLKWKKLTTKMLYHLADAPCHGNQFHDSFDDHPNGLKDDKPWEEIFKAVYDMDINYLFYDIGARNKKMFSEFRLIFEKCGEEKSHLIFSTENLIINYDSSSYKSTKKMASLSTAPKNEIPGKSKKMQTVSKTLDSIKVEKKVEKSFNSEEKVTGHSEQWVTSTVSNAKAQMMKNISYQQSKMK